MTRYQVQQGDSLWAIAQRNGITLEQLLRRNPGISRDGVLQPGTELRLGRGNRGDTPYEASIDGGPGESNQGGPEEPGGRPGRKPGVAWQDPEFLAFMRQFGYNRGLIREKKKFEVDRLRNQFKQNAGMFKDQRQQHRRDTNNDFSGRGMFFSGGRQRDMQLGLDRINMVREKERSVMKDAADKERFDARVELDSWDQRRAEERLAARERQTQLDIDIATGRA